MNPEITLSKSDFQLASTCAKKLVYKKQYYPTTNDTNEYMEMLAKGGHIIGKMATLLYPSGIEISGSVKDSIQHTKELLLKHEDCVLFEAAIQSGEKIIRIDILEKAGNKIHLIEVKAKSHNSEDDDDPQINQLEKYIEDVAYQYFVIKEAYPHFQIESYLLMPDKSKRTGIEGLAGWFSLNESKAEKKTDAEVEELPAQQKPRFQKPEVLFKYENDPERLKYLELLKQDGLLQLRPVQNQVDGLQTIIKNRADQYLRILRQGINSSDYKINKDCKSCEFRTNGLMPDGFKECWNKMADSTAHIFDLYHGGSIKNEEKEFYLNELIGKSKSSLFDIDPDRLKKKNGDFGKRALRQIIQLNHTRSNTEWISPDLKTFITGFKYPLHLIDFETYTGALPFHKVMRPYELIAFQWSCHTIPCKGDKPLHRDWIQTSEEFPNFEFAKSLMNHIGYDGTPFMWATHENTVLRTILNQMEIFEYTDPELKQWLLNITSDNNTKREGRFVDMNEMTQQYYFHPEMRGQTSIKKVLPAIWNNFPYLHQVEYFKNYAARDFEGGIIDPYDTLFTDLSHFEDKDAVSGGTDAMRAFQRIRFDDTLTEEHKNELKRQLLEYCKLDTMAMVIIGYHWGFR